MNVILSIKPQYSQAILNGTKLVEFRKTIFKQTVNRIYIYETAPTQKIVGYFTLDRIDENSPQNLWAKYGEVGSISYQLFSQYFNNRAKGFSLVIKDVVSFRVPISPNDVLGNFVPPQSFMYINKEL